jgi:hypothetical protein
MLYTDESKLEATTSQILRYRKLAALYIPKSKRENQIKVLKKSEIGVNSFIQNENTMEQKGLTFSSRMRLPTTKGSSFTCKTQSITQFKSNLHRIESTNIEGFINNGVYDRKIVPLPE